MQSISIDKIIENPRNPRKDLGDLTELVESIKIHGILQNLTVVPAGEKFVLVIGHRRFAAAKKAGLEEVPCNVTEMSVNEQVAVMLAENMQRGDLTVVEESDGFQMMLDLGESVSGISEATGFSAGTVKNRLALQKFDHDALVDKQDQISLMALVDLATIEDEDERNKILYQSKDDNQLRQRISFYKREKERKDFKEQVIEAVKAAGFIHEDGAYSWSADWTQVGVLTPGDIWQDDLRKVKELYEQVFWNSGYDDITLYIRASDAGETEDEKAEREEREAMDRRRKDLDDLAEKLLKKRDDFARLILTGEIKFNKDTINDLLLDLLTMPHYVNFPEIGDIEEAFEFASAAALEDDVDVDDFTDDYVLDYYRNEFDPANLALVFLIMTVCDKAHSWMCNHTPDEQSEHVINYMVDELGYVLTDEEAAYYNGTHELYVNA